MDISEALKAAALVQCAYQRESIQDPEYVLPAGFELVSHVVGNDLASFGEKIVPYGLIAREIQTGGLYVALRGSRTLDDFIQDLLSINLASDDFSKQRVGSGFLHVANSLKFDLPVVYGSPTFAGHSMGAALAVILASRYSGSVYGFACPNVGDQGFADWHMRRCPETYRFVVGDDPVPRLPFVSWGFRPVGETHELGLVPNVLQAHFMASYEAKLEAA